MATLTEAHAILDALTKELASRQSEIETLDQAYRGKFALEFASDDFDEYFAAQYAGFSDNWTQVVADAPHERLEITGIRHDGAEKGDGDLWKRWLENEADAYSDLAFLDAIIAKRSFALVWGNSDDEAVVTWEHPSQAIVGYDPETRKRAGGAKIWSDDKHDFATLYLPDEVWKFQRARGMAGRRASGLIVAGSVSPGGWEPRQPAGDDTWPLPNPLGEVSMVELQNKPRLIGEPMSDISGTLSMQHAINLIWAQLFAVIDERALSARVITGAERPTVPVLDDNGQQIGTKPVDLKKIRRNRTLWLENPAAKIDEWGAASFDGFTSIIDKAVGHISSQSRTPATYFMGGGSTIANVGDDSLVPLETGLVMRTREKTQHFGRSAREVFRLMALAESEKGKAASVATGTVLWRDIESRSDAQRTDALQKKSAIGYPFRYILELDGLSDPEIDRVMDMVDAEASDPLLSAALGEIVKPANAGDRE